MDRPTLFDLNDRPIDYTLTDQMSFSLSQGPLNFVLNAEVEITGARRLLEDGAFRLLENGSFRLLE